MALGVFRNRKKTGRAFIAIGISLAFVSISYQKYYKQITEELSSGDLQIAPLSALQETPAPAALESIPPTGGAGSIPVTVSKPESTFHVTPIGEPVEIYNVTNSETKFIHAGQDSFYEGSHVFNSDMRSNPGLEFPHPDLRKYGEEDVWIPVENTIQVRPCKIIEVSEPTPRLVKPNGTTRITVTAKSPEKGVLCEEVVEISASETEKETIRVSITPEVDEDSEFQDSRTLKAPSQPGDFDISVQYNQGERRTFLASVEKPWGIDPNSIKTLTQISGLFSPLISLLGAFITASDTPWWTKFLSRKRAEDYEVIDEENVQ